MSSKRVTSSDKVAAERLRKEKHKEYKRRKYAATRKVFEESRQFIWREKPVRSSILAVRGASECVQLACLFRAHPRSCCTVYDHNSDGYRCEPDLVDDVARLDEEHRQSSRDWDEWQRVLREYEGGVVDDGPPLHLRPQAQASNAQHGGPRAMSRSPRATDGHVSTGPAYYPDSQSHAMPVAGQQYPPSHAAIVPASPPQWQGHQYGGTRARSHSPGVPHGQALEGPAYHAHSPSDTMPAAGYQYPSSVYHTHSPFDAMPMADHQSPYSYAPMTRASPHGEQDYHYPQQSPYDPYGPYY